MTLVFAQLTSAFDIPVFRAFIPTLSYFCVAVIINSAIHESRGILTSVLELKPRVWLGTLSYSVYLWQQPFAPYATGSNPAWFRQFPLNLLFAFILAIFSFYVVERPFSSLRRGLRQKAQDYRGPPMHPIRVATSISGAS